MNVRRAGAADAAAIAAIIMPTIREGTTYALDADITEAEALAYWLGPEKETFVAERGGIIVGTYFIRANQAGGGRHVCNCGYMTSAAATGQGVPRRTGEIRPTMDGSKPANGRDPRPVRFYPAVASACNV